MGRINHCTELLKHGQPAYYNRVGTTELSC